MKKKLGLFIIVLITAVSSCKTINKATKDYPLENFKSEIKADIESGNCKSAETKYNNFKLLYTVHKWNWESQIFHCFLESKNLAAGINFYRDQYPSNYFEIIPANLRWSDIDSLPELRDTILVYAEIASRKDSINFSSVFSHAAKFTKNRKEALKYRKLAFDIERESLEAQFIGELYGLKYYNYKYNYDITQADIDSAKYYFNLAIELDSLNESAYQSYANLFLESQDYPNSIKLNKKAINILQSECSENIKRLDRMKSEGKNVKNRYEKINSIEETSISTSYRQIHRAYLALGDSIMANINIDSAIVYDCNKFNLYEKAEFLNTYSNFTQSNNILKKAISFKDQEYMDYSIKNLMAWNHYGLNEKGLAKERGLEALELEPESNATNRLLIMIELETGDNNTETLHKLNTKINHILENKIDFHVIDYNLKSVINYRLGNKMEAIAWIKKALELVPDNKTFKQNLILFSK